LAYESFDVCKGIPVHRTGEHTMTDLMENTSVYTMTVLMEHSGVHKMTV